MAKFAENTSVSADKSRSDDSGCAWPSQFDGNYQIHSRSAWGFAEFLPQEGVKMSRISYSDEEDYPGQFDLWQANCDRSIEGKKGQAALRELEQALLELPEKKLIGHKLQDEGGGVCAIGAVVKHRGASVKTTPEDVEEVGIELGFPRMVAWKVVCLNDIEVDGRYEQQLDGRHKFTEVTDEKRYCQVLSQVQKWIKPEPEKATM